MIKPTFLRRVAIAALLSGSCFSAAAAPPAPPVSYGVEEDVFHPVRAKQGMVASVDATATQVGVDILKEGGNAVDAAVAVGYALAVTHPQAGNLGGGGFMLIRSKNGNTTAIDFREMAPAKATRDMFLDDQGNPDSKKSLTSHLASGTPGTVAGFSLALDKYGTMPLNKQEEMLEEVAGDALLTIRRRFPDFPIALNLSEDILYLPMEPMLIKQVIVNLLENAIRHSGDREHIQLHLFRQDDWAVVEVRDRGRGISPEVSRAVQSGRQLTDNLSGDSSRGMGIGLSVCQSIIKAHDGFFAAGNDPEGGAVFRFGLPMEEIKDE